MALVELPCLIGGDCAFKTIPLEYDQAKEQLDGHMRYVHQARPENLPRPKVGPKLNKQQKRGEPISDGWERFELKKDGEVKMRYSRKKISGKDKYRCEETECQVGINFSDFNNTILNAYF